FALTDKVTVAAWVYLPQGQPAGDYAGIVTNLYGLGNGNRPLLPRASRLDGQATVGDTTYNHFFTLPSDQRSAWHHYALVYDGSRSEERRVGKECRSSKPQSRNIKTGKIAPTNGEASTVTTYNMLISPNDTGMRVA